MKVLSQLFKYQLNITTCFLRTTISKAYEPNTYGTERYMRKWPIDIFHIDF